MCGVRGLGTGRGCRGTGRGRHLGKLWRQGRGPERRRRQVLGEAGRAAGRRVAAGVPPRSARLRRGPEGQEALCSRAASPGRLRWQRAGPLPCRPNEPRAGLPVNAKPRKGLCFRNWSSPWGERDREPRLLEPVGWRFCWFDGEAETLRGSWLLSEAM